MTSACTTTGVINGDTSITIVVPKPVAVSAPSPTNQPPVLSISYAIPAYFEIYRNGIQISSTTSNTFIDTNAPQGVNNYLVIAFNASGVALSNSFSISVIYDTTPPIISYNITPTQSINGWYNSPVTISFTCNDDLSGIIHAHHLLI